MSKILAPKWAGRRPPGSLGRAAAAAPFFLRCLDPGARTRLLQRRAARRSSKWVISLNVAAIRFGRRQNRIAEGVHFNSGGVVAIAFSL